MMLREHRCVRDNWLIGWWRKLMIPASAAPPSRLGWAIHAGVRPGVLAPAFL